MNYLLIIIHIVIALDVLLILIVGILSYGRQRLRNDAVLSTIWIVLITLIFLLYTLTDGFIAIGLSFVYGILLNPVSRWICRKIEKIISSNQ